MKKITEEMVTINIMQSLVEEGYKILAFDYPQSGTGVRLYPDSPNLPNIILDVIAICEQRILIFENKDRYYPNDFKKLSHFKENISAYKNSFEITFNIDIDEYTITSIVGLPYEESKKIKPNIRILVDKIWKVKL